MQLQNPALFTNRRTGAPSGSEERAELKAWLKATSTTALHDVPSLQTSLPMDFAKMRLPVFKPPFNILAKAGAASTAAPNVSGHFINHCTSSNSLLPSTTKVSTSEEGMCLSAHIETSYPSKLMPQVQMILLVKALWPRTTFGSQCQ